MTPRTYPHPRPRLVTVRLLLMLVPFCAGVCAAGMRTAAAANLISYWQWPEAVCVAVCIEIAELAFLLRVVWTRDNGHQDALSTFGMVAGIAASISFSVLLAFVALDRLSGMTQTAARVAAIVAAVAVNVITFLLSREIARYVVEHESAVSEWESKRVQWENRRADRADKQRTATGQTPDTAVQSVQPPDKYVRMLDAYRTNPSATVQQLCTALDCGRTTVYALRKELTESGRLLREGDGYHVQ